MSHSDPVLEDAMFLSRERTDVLCAHMKQLGTQAHKQALERKTSYLPQLVAVQTSLKDSLGKEQSLGCKTEIKRGGSPLKQR